MLNAASSEIGAQLARRAKTQKEAAATMSAARVTAQTLHTLAAKRLSQAQAQRLEARREDLHLWEQRKVKQSKTGPKAYSYYMASWREEGKMRNVYLGSSQKMSREVAQERARALKREALGPLPPQRAVISCHESGLYKKISGP